MEDLPITMVKILCLAPLQLLAEDMEVLKLKLQAMEVQVVVLVKQELL